jgi:hypothetical protein
VSDFTAFSAPLLIQYDKDASQALGADHWRVAREFKYFIGSENSKRWITVPAGYLTDGASVPRALWSIIPPWGAYGQAAVVHDILCEYLSIMVSGKLTPITRERADEIFAEAMAVLQVPPRDIALISEGVKLYRLASGVSAPSTRLEKRLLEANWA